MAKYQLVTLFALLGLLSSTALATIPWNRYFYVPSSPFGRDLARIPDPPARIIKGPAPKEPFDPYERVYRCWGYLGKPEAIGWVKLFFINGQSSVEDQECETDYVSLVVHRLGLGRVTRYLASVRVGIVVSVRVARMPLDLGPSQPKRLRLATACPWPLAIQYHLPIVPSSPKANAA
ncbi:hypothetical protein M5K25_015647 [Dendrobium thyrsiflorum]|uniref:Uncharacterized protein n=1 Tax=Dendrobium thyrsiflorum TaxID=117978 RepID=A0ABD0URR3_DENTH